MEYKVISYYEIRANLIVKQYKGAGYKVKVTTPNGNSEQWHKHNLKVIPKVQTYNPQTNNWLDFRADQPPHIITTANYSSSPREFSNSGLVQNSEGLTRNSTTYTNFMGVFYSYSIPLESRFTREFILKFFNGNFVVGAGFGSIDVNWDKSIRENCTAMISLENRAYSKAFFGKGGNYYGQEYVTGANWNNSFIHVVLDYSPDKTTVKGYSRATLDYDWDIASDGEFVFDFSQGVMDVSRRGNTYSDDEARLCPYIEIKNPSSLGYIVGLKLS